MTLLGLAKRGDMAELRRRLEANVRLFEIYSGQMTDSEKLYDEALTFLKLGEMPDVIVRLERAAHPKWDNHRECEVQYEAAMTEKRQREATA